MNPAPPCVLSIGARRVDFIGEQPVVKLVSRVNLPAFHVKEQAADDAGEVEQAFHFLRVGQAGNLFGEVFDDGYGVSFLSLLGIAVPLDIISIAHLRGFVNTFLKKFFLFSHVLR